MRIQPLQRGSLWWYMCIGQKFVPLREEVFQNSSVAAQGRSLQAGANRVCVVCDGGNAAEAQWAESR